MALRSRNLSTNDRIQLSFGILATILGLATLFAAGKLCKRCARAYRKAKRRDEDPILPVYFSPGAATKGSEAGLLTAKPPRAPLSSLGTPPQSNHFGPNPPDSVDYWFAEARSLRMGSWRSRK